MKTEKRFVQNFQGPLRLSAVSNVPLIFPEAPLMHFLDPGFLEPLSAPLESKGPNYISAKG